MNTKTHEFEDVNYSNLRTLIQDITDQLGLGWVIPRNATGLSFNVARYDEVSRVIVRVTDTTLEAKIFDGITHAKVQRFAKIILAHAQAGVAYQDHLRTVIDTDWFSNRKAIFSTLRIHKEPEGIMLYVTDNDSGPMYGMIFKTIINS